MTEAELRELIRATISEILNAPPRRALVLFTGAMIGLDASIEALGRIVAAGVPLDYVLTPAAERMVDTDALRAAGLSEAGTGLVVSHDMLIVPTLTVNTAAKVAHCIADTLATNVIHEFLLCARPIVAVRTAACPDSPDKCEHYPNLPAGLAAVMRANLDTLASFGVRLTDASGLCDEVLRVWSPATAPARTPAAAPAATSSSSTARPVPAASVVDCPLPLLSQRDVQGVPAGSVLRLRRSARVTALAADAARARSIRIEKSQEG